MCGICGIVNFNGCPVQESEIRDMMKTVKHRGPDDEGIFTDKNIGLGCVRLSIIDLSPAGHQPMVSDNDRYVIIFNGEIYNYIELRQELELTRRYHFRTKTDTEVLLNAYREWGKECLHRFNGMFAFVIYDKKTRKLFAARDRFGIKPFYYHLDQNRIIFASEQRAILTFLRNRTPNRKAIFEYLVYNRTDQGDYTFFRDIGKLPHGSRATMKNGELKVEKWYELKDQLKEPFSEAQEFYHTFKESIKFRLRSDVPVGVCLSGGLDSSSIVSVLIKEFNKRDINAFSAVYEKGEEADESVFINEFKNELKNMFFTTPSAESLMADLKSFINCHSEPVAALGPYAQFKVMQLAKNHVTVTLDGQGADEQLGGYHYFFASYFKFLLNKFRLLRLIKEMAAYGQKHRSLVAIKYLGLYMAPSFLKDRLSKISHDYINEDFYREGTISSHLKTELYNPGNLNESLIQHFEFKLEHLLKWEDHNSMWHSLESRVPFLDHHLVERTLSLSPGKIIKNGSTKYMLRQAMKGILPEKISTRQDKIGFATPWDKWFKTVEFKNLIFDILHSAAFRERELLSREKCLKGFEKFIAGKISIPKEVWKWVNLELWFRAFIDREQG